MRHVAPSPRAAFVVEVMIFITALSVVVALVIPQRRMRRHHCRNSACYANMKTIAGAIEMYNLDQNVSVDEIDGGLITALVQDGYLQSYPKHPCTNRDAWEVYQLDTNSSTIHCVDPDYPHGYIQEGTT